MSTTPSDLAKRLASAARSIPEGARFVSDVDDRAAEAVLDAGLAKLIAAGDAMRSKIRVAGAASALAWDAAKNPKK